MGGKFGAVSLTATFTNDTGAFTTPTGFSNAGKTLVTNTATSAAWSIVVSSSEAASMAVTADKTGYETGSIVTLTFKGLDVNGLILPDSYSYGITSTSDIAVAGVNASGIVSLPSTNLGTSIKFGGLGSAGVGNTTIDAAGTLWPYASATPGVVTVKFYAPLVQGPFNITVKRGATNYATAIAATSSVLALNASNAVADAAAGVAQAAADAAAEATTAAAQDAADAVAALSTSVAAMINALKKQITSLTNLVVKIQKKVRA
jgi:flagellin-like hook-associated protein FlgL